METFFGLARDFIAAVLGLAILFGADFSDAQVSGILLVVATGLALGAWLYGRRQAAKTGL